MFDIRLVSSPSMYPARANNITAALQNETPTFHVLSPRARGMQFNRQTPNSTPLYLKPANTYLRDSEQSYEFVFAPDGKFRPLKYRLMDAATHILLYISHT